MSVLWRERQGLHQQPAAHRAARCGHAPDDPGDEPRLRGAEREVKGGEDKRIGIARIRFLDVHLNIYMYII